MYKVCQFSVFSNCCNVPVCVNCKVGLDPIENVTVELVDHGHSVQDVKDIEALDAIDKIDVSEIGINKRNSENKRV